jgi:hypothetical protein
METYTPGQKVKIGKYKGVVIADAGFFVKVKLNNGVTQFTKKENVIKLVKNS